MKRKNSDSSNLILDAGNYFNIFKIFIIFQIQNQNREADNRIDGSFIYNTLGLLLVFARNRDPDFVKKNYFLYIYFFVKLDRFIWMS